MPTVRELLREAATLLREAGLDSSTLDAGILLGLALDLTREQLYARLTDSPGPEAEARFRRLVSQRLAGVPVAYLRGFKEFYGRDFVVDSRVLIPRPETEILVDCALELVREVGHSGGRVHDCCTGSGCVAITLKAELPHLEVSASDISPGALDVARENRRRLLEPAFGPEAVTFFPSDLVSQAAGDLNMITANPPYVAEDEVREILAKGSPEPPEALIGGKIGIETPRRLFNGALEHLGVNGYLLMEVGFGQASGLMEEMEATGYRGIGSREDLQGIPRVVYGRKE
ncbi:MAG: peptide chain release factor N(5)-glutamine methyltransferase [Spirochaetaceae bacterium]